MCFHFRLFAQASQTPALPASQSQRKWGFLFINSSFFLSRGSLESFFHI